MLDRNTREGARAAERMQQEQIIWLTTVNSGGQPQSSPVWFFWDGERILLFSKPDQKVRNIERRPKVSLHFSDTNGGDVVSIEGRAEIDAKPSGANQNPAYVEKYREGIARIGLDPERMAAAYSKTIRITPTRIRTW